MILSKSIDLFLVSLAANGYSPSTRELYRWALGLMTQYLGADRDLADIKADDLDRFWKWLRNDYAPDRKSKKAGPLAGRSLENVWTAERTFFRFCIESGKLKRRPDLRIKKPEYAERIIEPFTEEEVSRLLQAALRTRVADTKNRTPYTMPRSTAKRDTAIIMLLAETGIRVSECARLARGDIDFDTSVITVQAFGTGRKTKYRQLEIGRKTRQALWDYMTWREDRERRNLEADDLIFMTLRGNPMNKDSIRQVLNEIGASAGIPNVHPHRFRHFFASMMAADDIGESELMEKIGHSTAKMTRRYVHLHRVQRKKRTSIIDRLNSKAP